MTDFTQWVGTTASSIERADERPLRSLAATLDLDVTAELEAGEVPAMWHWLYFLPDTSTAFLGPDGHPPRGVFMPPVELPRRMFAGGKATFSQSASIGEILQRESTVAAVVEKDGRQGRLVLVTVRSQVYGERGPVVDEEQVIAYTNAPPALPVTITKPIPPGDVALSVETNTVLLFRFSALTFNSHRIHFDLPYTRSVEGYSNLVVQGPLVALLMLHLGTRLLQSAPRMFEFRASAPFFVGEVIELRAHGSAEGADITAYRQDATPGMTAVLAI
jgi:3-methylfumaryl-CoA hydratase